MRKLIYIDNTSRMIFEISNKFEIEMSYEFLSSEENFHIFYRVFILSIFIRVKDLGQNFY